MRILALSSYPVEAAATRFRVQQFIDPLAENGIDLHLRPFLSSEQFGSLYRNTGISKKIFGTTKAFFRRLGGLAGILNYDLLFVQREAMFFGPAIFEWLYRKIGRMPMVLDLDDATYIAYESPTYGKLGSLLKFFGKTDRLIDRAELVICGNRFIAEYAEKRGARTVVIPTIVDTDVFTPIERTNPEPVLGWIGTHSTFPFLESIFPVIEELAKRHQFRLRIVGAGRVDINIPGVLTDNLEWNLEREVRDFQSIDIGLYPMDSKGPLDPAWLAGKSGFKAIQYLAVGVPFVMSPIGVCAEIGESGKTHFNANTPEDWYNSLDRLLSSEELRIRMGRAGHSFSAENYALPRYAKVLADALHSVADARKANYPHL